MITATRFPLLKAASVLTMLAFGASLSAAGPADAEAIAKIRAEAREHSQIMRTLHFLTDVYGPRLTGSPNYKAAAEWALQQMRDWGLENAHLEPWDFGHPGWLNERFSGFIVSPVKDSLVGEVLAWTPGTNGPTRARALRIEPVKCEPVAPPAAAATPAAPAPAPATAAGPGPQAGPARENCPTEAELTASLDPLKAKVKGMMVLVGAPIKVPVTLNPPPTRRDDEQVRKQYDLDNPAPSPFANIPDVPPTTGRLTAAKVTEIVDAFLVANGALVRVNDAGREHGQIRAFNNRTFDLTKAVPTVVLRNEDYGRISRLVDDDSPVELDFNIVNHSYPEGKTSYNAVAEIPGTDKKGEVVMLGAHLDSWHAATGATDNAAGSAIMMEAVRILKATNLRPRRTVRIALWGGEEEGLLGSKAYVAEHFGTFENPKPDYASFAGYFNVDSGTGRLRGAGIFGPKEAGLVMREVLLPFADLGVAGASVSRGRRAGGTDSGSFNEAGLPGIGLGQDPIQYNSHTWHTNLDTYERIIEDDAIKAATVVAGAVYQVAMRDEMLPRFAQDQMPAPPPPPTPTPTPLSAAAPTPKR